MADGDRRLAECLAPFWQPGIQHNESVLMWARDGERPSAPLLFHADKILSVRDSSLQITWEEGRDWIYRDEKLVLPEGSRIPWMTAAELYPAEPGPDKPRTTMPRLSGGYLLFREGNFFHQHQLAITYTHHAIPRWEGPVPQLAATRLPRTLEKLRTRTPLTIIAYGDSITVGANASGFGKTPAAPFQPVWTELFRRWLSHAYGHRSITLRNKAVGGKGTAWGVQNAARALARDPADLVIIAFGMNDRSLAPEKFREHTVRMMEAARKANPEVEFILVQSMLNNPDWQSHGNLPAFGKVLQNLSGPGVAFCDMMAVHSALLRRKRYEDMTGNHVNHPNDFLIRAYAQIVAGQLAPLPETTDHSASRFAAQ
ncbi:lysophospholipase L1-like esterase [Opitutaceae bacterium TAV1]|nr:lysophospholipase L1-like esterase [Opitutaceae bacterium TAV1]